MPGNKDTVGGLRYELKDYLHRFPADVHEPAVSLAMCTFCKTRFTSHIHFIGHCLRRKVIPVGFSIKFHTSSLSNGYVKNVRSITYTCSRNLMQATVRSMTTKWDLAFHDIEKHCEHLRRVSSEETFHLIQRQIHELNSRVYESLKSTKERKFAQLCGKRQNQPAEINTYDDHDYQSKLVVTIPDDLPLSEAEKSVLSKGLSFVPVKESTDEYQVKPDCKKFYWRLHLRTHFHNEEVSGSQATPDTCDPFAKLNDKESTWTPPEGKFTAIDHYVDRCRRAVDALDFKTKTRHNNLPPSEKQALLDLNQRDDIVIKPADKGGAVVVWLRPLYDAEAHKQLSDGRFYERLDHDPVKEYQQVIKSAVKQMIEDNELPASAKNLVLQTPRTSRFYLLPKIHKENNSGRPIVSACNSPTENIASYLDMVMSPLVCNLKTYVKDTNHALEIDP